MKTEKTYTEDHQVKLTTEIESELSTNSNAELPGRLPAAHASRDSDPKAPYNMVLSYVGEERIFQEAIDLLVEMYIQKSLILKK